MCNRALAILLLCFFWVAAARHGDRAQEVPPGRLSVTRYIPNTSSNLPGYYIDYAGGSDSHAGTSALTAWKNHPYSRAFSGSYTHQVGDHFYFKGGVTWPNTHFQMAIVRGGNAASNDYYGVDRGWYTGASWTRPLFDFENKYVTNAAGQTDFSRSAGVLLDGFNTTGITNIIFDSLEFARLRMPPGGSGVGTSCLVGRRQVNQITVTNCVFRDWDMPPIAPGDDAGNGGGIWQIDANPVNNISGWVITGCTFTQSGAAQRCGGAIHGFFGITNCEVHDVSNGLFGSGTWANNLIHDIVAATDPLSHENSVYAQFPSTIYGNYVYNVSTDASAIYCAPNVNYDTNNWYLVYNNVVYNVGNQEPISIDQETTIAGGARCFNNTLEHGASPCLRVGTKSHIGSFYAENNHFITSSGTPISYNPAFIDSTPVISSNLTQTPTAAAAQGYTSGNQYRPTAGGSTIGAGTNLTAQGYTTAIGGTNRVVPWDGGAYQYPQLRGVFVWPLTNSTSGPGLVEITNNVNQLAAMAAPLYLADATSSHLVAITNGTAWDDLADIIRVAKARGIDTYLWYAPYLVKAGGPELTAHPEWTAVTRAGVTNTAGICLFRPEVRAWELSLITNLVPRYPDLAGVHLEEPGYETINYCCCSYCTNWFQTNQGLNILSNTLPVFNAQAAAYTAAGTNFVGQLWAALKGIRSTLKLSSNTQSYGASTSARIGNNWISWTTNGWTDWFTPQLYDTNTASFSSDISSVFAIVPSVRLVPAIGIGWSSPLQTNTPATVTAQIIAARDLGASGFALFRNEFITPAMVTAVGQTP